MKTVYRLLRKKYAESAFDGEGSFQFGARWSSPGTRLAYTAEHLSLAMVEYLAHMSADDPPADLVLARAEIPDDFSRIEMTAQDLPKNWRSYPAPENLQAIGNRFAHEAKAALLIVPSVLAVTDNNWVLNPSHPEFNQVKILATAPFDYDPRLLRSIH